MLGSGHRLRSDCRQSARRPKSRALRACLATATIETELRSWVRVHYRRKDRRYSKSIGLHVWGDAKTPTDWQRPLEPTGWQQGHPFYDVPLREEVPQWLGLLLHQGETKHAGAPHVDVTSARELWLVGDHQHAYMAEPDLQDIPAGSLAKSAAHWVRRDAIVWRAPISEDNEWSSPLRRFTLHYSASAQLRVTGHGVEGADRSFPLHIQAQDIPPDVMGRYPHLYGCTHLALSHEAWQQAPELMRGQLAVSVHTHDGAAIDATGLQLAGALDDMCATDEPLGDHWSHERGCHALSVWAPTAQRVQLLHWWTPRGGEPSVHDMWRSERGVWTCDRPAEWTGSYYKYRVTVYFPQTQYMETVEATDPYSRCTAANGERSLLIDLWAAQHSPPGWREHAAPPLHHFSDISLYELHIRDFSATDATVPEHLRGTYRAFSPEAVNPDNPRALSAGQAHLRALSEAGLTHVHLLPSYDFGSVPERKEEQQWVQEDLSQYAPDSDRQQAAVLAVADQDAFNWGYDPVHYGVPEGSYSTDPDGPARVYEYREMVQGLHSLGLRVVLDVVYNHTFSSGPHDRHSVLDKVVPGYYHRRMEDGDICNSTCCNNTASEHAMFERLMVDDLVHWARDYRVDGFRFDIMGHHMVRNMTRIREALNRLTLQHDGVDGPHIYVYGEAWDFGEVALNQRGRNASQHNLGGSRIGAFNDRMRDGAMGGSPYHPPNTQGLLTGLYTDPNPQAGHQGTPEQQLANLLHTSDWVRFSLAACLRDFETQVADGRVVAGRDELYHGNQALCYGADPVEHVAFIGCHDNETIFDQVMMRAPPHADAEQRARICRLALALLTLSQGVPFVHAGDDLLRSKSLDRDSYNSGDWFNRVDWTGNDNNFGVGLPVATKNGHSWDFKRPLLQATHAYKPGPDLIRGTHEYFKALLRVRYSTPLLRMPTAESVRQQLRFHNTGPEQVPGVIVMQVFSSWQPDHGTWDPNHLQVVVVFNMRPAPYVAPFPPDSDALVLHPAMAALQQQDAALRGCTTNLESRELTVAARTATVFVQHRG